jgi:hypothetical protein
LTAIGPGSLVKCIRREPWVILSGSACGEVGEIEHGPAFGEVCRVASFGNYPNTIILVGWERFPPLNFQIKNFRPLDGDAELKRLRRLAKRPTVKVENPDAPVRAPEQV